MAVIVICGNVGYGGIGERGGSVVVCYIIEILKYVLWDLSVGRLNYRGNRVVALTNIALQGASAAVARCNRSRACYLVERGNNVQVLRRGLSPGQEGLPRRPWPPGGRAAISVSDIG